MNKIIFLLIIISALASCNKKENCAEIQTKAPESEVSNLKNYLTTNSISATEDARGFFYIIANTGTGNKPTICSSVTVNYEGKLSNGTSFDSGTNVSFALSGLIEGWKEGIPLIAQGGKITLYLPPSLAYGINGSGSIPGNANLIFIIDLVAVN
ncbi:hypothetical protein LBMAG27_02870 [Bacteroidota bacterium]|nr:hypothetical protein LBMAG27_02870 [Bacteroidota bacterium]